MERYNIIYSIILIITPLTSGIISGDTAYYGLHSDILQHYNRHLIPTTTSNDTIQIQLEIHLLQLVHFDETNGFVRFLGRGSYRWQDKLLQWDSSKYENIDSIQFPHQHIWMPQFYAVQTGKLLSHRTDLSKVTLDNNGWVESANGLEVEIPCQINRRYFPNDEHGCQLDIRFDEAQMAMAWTSAVLFTRLKRDTQWNIQLMASFVDGDTDLHIQFTMHRRDGAIKFDIWCSFLITLLLIVYMLGTSCTDGQALTAAATGLAAICFVRIVPNNSYTFENMTSYDRFLIGLMCILLICVAMKILINSIRRLELKLSMNPAVMKILQCIRYALCISDLQYTKVDFLQDFVSLHHETLNCSNYAGPGKRRANSKEDEGNNFGAIRNRKSKSDDVPAANSEEIKPMMSTSYPYDNSHNNKNDSGHHANGTSCVADQIIISKFIQLVEQEHSKRINVLVTNLLIAIFERLFLIAMCVLLSVLIVFMQSPKGL